MNNLNSLSWIVNNCQLGYYSCKFKKAQENSKFLSKPRDKKKRSQLTHFQVVTGTITATTTTMAVHPKKRLRLKRPCPVRAETLVPRHRWSKGQTTRCPSWGMNQKPIRTTRPRKTSWRFPTSSCPNCRLPMQKRCLFCKHCFKLYISYSPVYHVNP